MSGLLLLFTGGAGGDTISLPLLDDSVVFPAQVSSNKIDLTLIDGGEVLPPDLIEDTFLNLPLLDSGDYYGDTYRDGYNGNTFAPRVVLTSTASLPLIDGGELFGPSVIRTQGLNLPLLDGGWQYAPVVLTDEDVAAALEDGLTVRSYSRAGALLAELDLAHGKQWTDQVDDTGAGSCTVQNDDPDYAHTGFDRILRFFAGGQPRFASLVENRDVTSLATGGGADEVTRLFGRGVLALLEEHTVGPSRGVGALPIEVERSFSWPSPDFDSSSWPSAKQLAKQRHISPIWFAALPRAWPDPEAGWIWADRDDCTWLNAPSGWCLFRRTFTLAETRRVRIFSSADNVHDLYLDGAKLISGETFFSGQYLETTLSAGEHVLAIRGINLPDDGAAGGNPGAVICSVFSLDESGFLDDVLVRTDSTWDCLPYVGVEPGFTIGQVLRILIEEAQAAGACSGITLGFSDYLDSDGQPWDVESEITVTVGRSLLEVVQEMAGSVADIAMAPGGLQLRAWQYGTRGSTKAVTLEVGNLAGLSHQGKRTSVNAVLVKWSGGWLEETDSASITANGRRGVYLDLTAIQSEQKARELARETMSNRASPRYAVTAAVDPASALEAQALHALEPGDTITHPNESLAPEAGRIRAITVEETEHGRVDRSVRLNDLAEELESRFDRWLRRMNPGALAGGSRVVSPGSDPAPSARQISAIQVAEFSYEGTVDSSAVVRLLLNGSYIGDPITFTTGDEQKVSLNAQRVLANADHLQIEIDGVLSQRRPAAESGNLIDFMVTRTAEADGTAGLDAQARAI